MLNKFREARLPLKIVIVLAMFAAFVAFTFLFGLIVMLLWNWVMPDIFGLPRVDYWHAWGLLLLTHILFKSWGGRNWGPRPHRRHGRFVMVNEGGEKESAPSTQADGQP
jgi:hypothetical protein